MDFWHAPIHITDYQPPAKIEYVPAEIQSSHPYIAETKPVSYWLKKPLLAANVSIPIHRSHDDKSDFQVNDKPEFCLDRTCAFSNYRFPILTLQEAEDIRKLVKQKENRSQQYAILKCKKTQLIPGLVHEDDKTGELSFTPLATWLNLVEERASKVRTQHHPMDSKRIQTRQPNRMTNEAEMEILDTLETFGWLNLSKGAHHWWA